jgi:cysteine-rich repeat protein
LLAVIAMRKNWMRSALFAVLGIAGCGTSQEPQTESLVTTTPGVVARLSGAIFTTLEDGSRVNANIYAAKTDVYLDGGPGPGAPAAAACLPEGAYYFQVTDPPGMELLSTDDIGCRRFLVTEECTLDYAPVGCASPHVTGTDIDHGGDTIQLMPYLDTPNMGGEYKVWATPVDSYSPGDGRFGFLASDSKTDNYKVLSPEPECGDGNLDQGEQCDDGNNVGGDGCSATCQTEVPFCGDGIVDEGETCDDGNNEDGDGCSADCEIETGPECGNGVVEEGEQCDDGNVTDGDGCTAKCTTEEPPPVCGNGIVEGHEECDDGNDIDTDECTNECLVCPFVKDQL